MVSLPVNRPTNSNTISRNCSGDSPESVSCNSSTIMGTITSTQPARIRDSVPSKSKRTTFAAPAWTSLETISIISTYCGSSGQTPENYPCREPVAHAQPNCNTCLVSWTYWVL